MHVYIHKGICAYRDVCTRVCVRVCICTYMYIYDCACTYVYMTVPSPFFSSLDFQHAYTQAAEVVFELPVWDSNGAQWLCGIQPP